MAYTKNPTWVDGEGGGTRIDAADLQNIEDGLFAAAAVADGAIPKSLADAKGDLLVGSADNTLARLAVGANGAIPVADSNQTAGIGWQSPIPLLSNALTNSNFPTDTTGWAGSNATVAVVSAQLVVTCTDAAATDVGASQTAPAAVVGNRYYVAATIYPHRAHSPVVSYGGATVTADRAIPSATASRISWIVGASATTATFSLYSNGAVTTGQSVGSQAKFDNIVLIDLTATFGAGREPSLAEMDAYLGKYTNSWFADITPQMWSGADWLKTTQNACKNELTNGDFLKGVTGWTALNITLISVTGGELTTTATASGGRYGQAFAHVNAQKYYYAAWVKATSNLVKIDISGVNLAAHSGSGAYELLTGTWTATGTTEFTFGVRDLNVAGWANVSQKNVLAINLTSTFGAGIEPTKSEMDYLLSRYLNSWFNGTVNDMVSARKHYLRDRIGSGSPEGVITAPIGTGYTDILATCGAVTWVKKTGSTSSGWVPAEADTGTRILTSWDAAGTITGDALPANIAPTSGVAGSVRIRRVGPTVIYAIRGATWSAASTFTIPAGFRSATVQYRPAVVIVSSAATLTAATVGTSTLAIGASGQSAHATTGTVITWEADTWPTILPGS